MRRFNPPPTWDEAAATFARLAPDVDLSDPADIKRAYREASRRLHPDVGGSTRDMQELNAAYEVLHEGEPPDPWRPAPRRRAPARPRQAPRARPAQPPAPAPRRQPANRRDQRIAEVAAAALDPTFPTRSVTWFADQLYRWRVHDWPWHDDSRLIEMARLVGYAAELAVDQGGPIKQGYFASHDGHFFRTSCTLPYVEPTAEDVGTIPEILWRFRQWVEEGANAYHVAWVELDGRVISGTPSQPCPDNRHVWGGQMGSIAICSRCGLGFVVERDEEGFPIIGTARRPGDDARENPAPTLSDVIGGMGVAYLLHIFRTDPANFVQRAIDEVLLPKRHELRWIAGDEEGRIDYVTLARGMETAYARQYGPPRENPSLDFPPELMIEREGRSRRLHVQQGPLPSSYAEVAVHAGLPQVAKFLLNAQTGAEIEVSHAVARRLWTALQADSRFAPSSTLAFWRAFWRGVAK